MTTAGEVPDSICEDLGLSYEDDERLPAGFPDDGIRVSGKTGTP
jgi:hypothetical protein